MSVERVEQIGEKADEQKPLVIYYNNRDQPLEELLSFPIHPSMLGQTAKAPAPEETISQHEDDTSAPEEKISDASAPKVVNPALTGRIRPEWKGNGK